MRALLDACALYPWTLRDFLMRIAQAGAFTPLWSDEILDEFVGAILRNRKDMPAARLERTRSLMEAAFPRACVQVDAEAEVGLELPDPDDRHVLAAAIAGGAESIVTFNLKDFPSAALAHHCIVATHPDTFVVQLLARDPEAVTRALAAQVASLRNPPLMPLELLAILDRLGLPNATQRLRELTCIDS